MDYHMINMLNQPPFKIGVCEILNKNEKKYKIYTVKTFVDNKVLEELDKYAYYKYDMNEKPSEIINNFLNIEFFEQKINIVTDTTNSDDFFYKCNYKLWKYVK